MMNDLLKIEQEKSVLRWGGLAGMLGSILFIFAMIVVSVFVPPDPAELAEWVMRFPDIRVIRIVENGIYLGALILEIPLFLSLYFALRKTSLAPALFGSTFGILGLLSMIVSATPHVAHVPLSDLYHATGGVPPADLATLAILWQATRGIFDAMLYIGFFVVPIGLFILGLGMFGTLDFGRGFSWTILALGVVGFMAAVFQMIYPSSIIGVGSYFACLISYFVLGWKTYSLSKGPVGSFEDVG
jgi:hypothetical protein